MFKQMVNHQGVTILINQVGVLIEYSIDSEEIASLYFSDISIVYQNFKVKSIDELSGFKVVEQYLECL